MILLCLAGFASPIFTKNVEKSKKKEVAWNREDETIF